MKPSRFQLALAVAATLHGGLLVARAAIREKPPAPPTLLVVYEEEATVDIDTSQSTATNGETATGAAARRPVAGASRGRVGSASAQGDLSVATITSEGTVEPGAVAPTGSAGVISVWNTDLLAQRQLGVGDNREFAVPPPPMSDDDVVRRRVQHSLTDGLRDREVAAGGDPMSGPVVRALEDATTQGLAPVNGTATFDAIINSAGMIVSIGAVNASGNKAAWDDIAKASATGLAGKQLRKSKNGVIVRIEITSHNQLPSGSDPGFSADAFGSGKGTGVHLLPTGPAGARPAEFTPLSVSGDLSDIGGTARRVIGAHVTAIRDL